MARFEIELPNGQLRVEEADRFSLQGAVLVFEREPVLEGSPVRFKLYGPGGWHTVEQLAETSFLVGPAEDIRN